MQYIVKIIENIDPLKLGSKYRVSKFGLGYTNIVKLEEELFNKDVKDNKNIPWLSAKDIDRAIRKQNRSEMKVKARLKAPKGGVTVHGKFYPGGQWIPGDVQDDMTEAEKDAVRAGKDVGGVDSEGDGKENPEADKLDIKQLVAKYGPKKEILRNTEALSKLKAEEWHDLAIFAYESGAYSNPLQTASGTAVDEDYLNDIDNLTEIWMKTDDYTETYQEWKDDMTPSYLLSYANDFGEIDDYFTETDEYTEGLKKYHEEVSDLPWEVEDLDKLAEKYSYTTDYETIREDWLIDNNEEVVKRMIDADLLIFDDDNFLLGDWIYDHEFQIHEEGGDSIYTTPIPFAPDSSFYHGTTVELSEILQSNVLGTGDGLYISSKLTTAGKYGNKIFKMKANRIDNIFLDPDIWHPQGWPKERDNMQYLDGIIDLKNIEGIYLSKQEVINYMGDKGLEGRTVAKELNAPDYYFIPVEDFSKFKR